LGLSGGFGAVRIGYQYTNVYEVSTLSGYMLGSEGVHGADFAHAAGNSYVGGTRANGITYISPNLGGFTAQLQYGAGASLQSFTHNSPATKNAENTANQFEADRTSLMGKFAQGPLSVAVAHTMYKNGADTATTTPYTGAVASVTAVLTQVAASYDLGVAKIGMTHNIGDNKVAAANQRKVTASSVSASVPMGATALVAAYHMIDEKNASTDASTVKGSGMQIGVIQNLSKRTAAYAFYGQNTFDNLAIATATAATAATDLKQTDITFGVRHSF
jgi:predicted porin